MKNGVAISYGDIALGAKESFVPSMEKIESFSDVSVLQKNNISFENYGNPIEKYSVLLDGSVVPFPSETEGKIFGIWSSSLSDDNGYFENPLILSLKSKEMYTSSGITLTFDEKNGIFPSEVVISWYRDDQKIDEQNFRPNSAKYFFNKKVEYYNGVHIEFLRLNMPKNRLKIHSIDYGIGVIFYGDELRNVRVSQSVDPISSQIEINTCDFEIVSKRNVEYSFQTQQPISVYFNGKLQSTCFVEAAKRKSYKVWSVRAEDYIGLMGSIPYFGGMYFDENADEIIRDIFSVAKVPYELESQFEGVKVSGHIPYTNCREALMQVCFAIGAVVDTVGLDLVMVRSLSQELSQEISANRVMVGQSIQENNVVTAVEMTAHAYKASDEALTAYDSSESGVGEEIFVLFDEPLHSLSISNGQILSSGSNHATITANEGCVLIGKKYEHTKITKSKRNPLVSPTDIENVVSVQNATLVSVLNVDKLLLSCYNYIVNSKSFRTKIIDGKHIIEGRPVKYGEKKYGEFKYGEFKYGDKTESVTVYDKPTRVGDIVIVPIDFYPSVQARITKQTFSLAGGITVKDTELR